MSYIDWSCFSEIIQKFLVCVTVHKAKNLHVLNADTFVVVSFDKIHKKTATYQNSDCPYFNEVSNILIVNIHFSCFYFKMLFYNSQKYFVFEKSCSLRELLKESIALRVVQKKILCRSDRVIGELIVDLFSIWEAKRKKKIVIYKRLAFDFV